MPIKWDDCKFAVGQFSGGKVCVFYFAIGFRNLKKLGRYLA